MTRKSESVRTEEVDLLPCPFVFFSNYDAS